MLDLGLRVNVSYSYIKSMKQILLTILVLLMTKLKHREVKELAHSYRVIKHPNWGL